MHSINVELILCANIFIALLKPNLDGYIKLYYNTMANIPTTKFLILYTKQFPGIDFYFFNFWKFPNLFHNLTGLVLTAYIKCTFIYFFFLNIDIISLK